jgi:cytochrome b6-f complex iron-sulfur subunit
VDAVVRTDAYLNALRDERRPAGTALDTEELRMRLAAAKLRMAADDVETARPAFLASLERTIERETAKQRRTKRSPISRMGFLRAAATLAGGAGLGVAGVEGVAVLGEQSRPRELVTEGNQRWYAVAQTADLVQGTPKPFTAGGVMGFLIQDASGVRALSAICTHMGCRLKADPGVAELRCLCHGSRFSHSGAVLSGMAPSSLPEIAVREANGVVYALGTRETV